MHVVDGLKTCTLYVRCIRLHSSLLLQSVILPCGLCSFLATFKTTSLLELSSTSDDTEVETTDTWHTCISDERDGEQRHDERVDYC